MSERYLSPNWHRYSELKPQLRSGVRLSAHRYLGEIWYVLRDPLSAQHHRFTPAACRVIAAMDGTNSVEAIWREALERDGELAPTQGDVQRLLVQLSHADLIALDVAPGTHELDVRRGRHARQQRERMYKNPLSIIVPLFNPDPLLIRLAHIFALIPAWLRAGLFLALVLPALVIGLSVRTELFANFSDTVLSFNNLILLALLTPVVKLWHELGHGVISRLYGGPVREFGVMLIAFYPMPYVDASASSAFPSKWQRIHVAAAGMLWEFGLAALALFLWLAVEDGLVKAIAFNTIVIAGVSTLIINGNPLLRYDGYYILCDLMEMPNLGQRANKFWGYLIQHYLFGARAVKSEPLSRRERLTFIAYAPLAWLYRTIVVLGIALFVAQHYLLPGIAIAIWSLWLSVLLPAFKALRTVFTGEQLAGVRRRAVAVSAATATALATLSLIPIPLHTMAEGVVWLPENAIVRAGASGFVTTLAAAPGAQVDSGATLGNLSNPAMEGELAVQRLKVVEAETRLAADTFGDQARLVLLRRELEDARAATLRLQQRVDRLRLAAGADGRFVAPGAVDLPGRFIAEGTVIGHILPPLATTVRMVVTQDNIELVRSHVGAVAVRLLDAPERTIAARISRAVPAASRELPSAALGTSGGGALPVDPSDDKGMTAISGIFQFDLELAEPVAPLFGLRAAIKLTHEPESLASQVRRRLRQLFLSWFAV